MEGDDLRLGQEFSVLHQNGFDANSLGLLVNVHSHEKGIALIVTVADARHVCLHPERAVLEGSPVEVRIEVCDVYHIQEIIPIPVHLSSTHNHKPNFSS